MPRTDAGLDTSGAAALLQQRFSLEVERHNEGAAAGTPCQPMTCPTHLTRNRVLLPPARPPSAQTSSTPRRGCVRRSRSWRLCVVRRRGRSWRAPPCCGASTRRRCRRWSAASLPMQRRCRWGEKMDIHGHEPLCRGMCARTTLPLPIQLMHACPRRTPPNQTNPGALEGRCGPRDRPQPGGH